MPSRNAVLLFLGLAAACFIAAGCSLEPTNALYPSVDLRPPGLLAAGPTDSRKVALRFDEDVTVVAGSIASDPPASMSGSVDGENLVVNFDTGQAPGANYSLVGEVQDLRGNTTRFLIRFVGWNDRAPPLLLSEVQTGKNSSKTKPHRDFVELVALADGNLGGEELTWTSSVKSATYRFPGIEVAKGDFMVLHLAPEGLPEERDELGTDLSESGGVDATATGRDLWCATMGLPDASGAISVCVRPGADPMDGLFYADDSKTGAVGDGKLSDLIATLASAGAWTISGTSATWEDGVPWSGSTARSLCRSSPAKGASAWYVSASSAQSPGAPNVPLAAAATVPAVASVAASVAKPPIVIKAAKASKRSLKKKK